MRPRDELGKTRRRVAAELIADLERMYARSKAADKELAAPGWPLPQRSRHAARAAGAAGADIVRELTDEPWGVRRFFVRDPGGHVINILAHC